MRKLDKILERKEHQIPRTTKRLKGTSVDQINSLLTKTAYRMRFQSMSKIDPQSLIRELDVTYGKVVDLYISCRNKPKSASLHKLRKRSKDFLYQLYIFKPLNPSKIKNLEKKLESMTQNLGKFNDLSQILEILGL